MTVLSMSLVNNSVDRATFEDFYEGTAPWDIGKPQGRSPLDSAAKTIPTPGHVPYLRTAPPTLLAHRCRQNSGKTQAEVADPGRRRERAGDRRLADRAAGVPATAPEYPERDHPGNQGHLAALVRAPLPHVAVHVLKMFSRPFTIPSASTSTHNRSTSLADPRRYSTIGSRSVNFLDDFVAGQVL
jgi:hypothetical protein